MESFFHDRSVGGGSTDVVPTDVGVCVEISSKCGVCVKVSRKCTPKITTPTIVDWHLICVCVEISSIHGVCVQDSRKCSVK